ncbi:MAG: site-specific integrase [Polyangiaceae bacterium]
MRTGSPFAKTAAPSFGAFVVDTYRPVYMPVLRAATRRRYEALFVQGLSVFFGRNALDAIDAVTVSTFAASLSGRGVDPRGPTNLVRSVIRAAVRAGLLPAMKALPRFKLSRKLPDAPSVDEFHRLLAEAKGGVRVAIALSGYAGLRQGDLRALQVRDIDFGGSRIIVRHAFRETEVVTPKSNEERDVPMAPELAEVLKTAVRGKLPHAFVITNRNGRVPGRQHVLASLKSVQKRAKLTPRSFHQLRHFFCSRLLQVGGSIEVVRMLAGHANLNTTQRYVHASRADSVAAVTRIAGNRLATTDR